jgi:CDGSH-type Zn-finger protein
VRKYTVIRAISAGFFDRTSSRLLLNNACRRKFGGLVQQFGTESHIRAKIFVMSDAKIAQKGPYKINVVEGKKYFWCACGLSNRQPFCDGSHKNTDFAPVRYDALESKAIFFCGCKHTGSNPLCDGSHNKL